MPEGVTRPVCNDTGHVGENLADGSYWMTNSSTPRGRLHRSLADAQASVGLTTQQCVTNGTVISYQNIAPFGVALFNYDNGLVNHAFGVGDIAAQLPGEEPFIVTYMIDHNNPGYSFKINKLYINGALASLYETATAKALVPTGTADSKQAWTLWNSPEEHVPIDGKIYVHKLQTSANEITDAEIIAYHEYLRVQYARIIP